MRQNDHNKSAENIRGIGPTNSTQKGSFFYLFFDKTHFLSFTLSLSLCFRVKCPQAVAPFPPDINMPLWL